MDKKKIVALVMASGMAVAAMADCYPTNSVQFEERILASLKGDDTIISLYGVKYLNDDECAKLDARLYNTTSIYGKISMNISYIAKKLPKTARAYAETIKEIYPKYAEILVDKSNNMEKSYDIPFLLDSYVERSQLAKSLMMHFCETYAKKAISYATKSVRRKLREEGKPIVVVGGRDFAKERLDALTAALNSPRMKGTKEALAQCGVVIDRQPEMDFLPQKDSEEIKTLMDKIYYGEENFKAHSDKLRYILGVDEYNKFVTKYNSGM